MPRSGTSKRHRRAAFALPSTTPYCCCCCCCLSGLVIHPPLVARQIAHTISLHSRDFPYLPIMLTLLIWRRM
ncbi:hypothetical protein BDV29DRAFT_176086 [Aspergillus leporis]|uniref:Uncharacterized protein n=1 Tax=Aspergillus leporis TaxID=41062 RepID=A0A5N5WZC5_9EURO|nr:hypothetical protein BDV29DRAFT_176086 [Aspergillus leporis]